MQDDKRDGRVLIAGAGIGSIGLAALAQMGLTVVNIGREDEDFFLRQAEAVERRRQRDRMTHEVIQLVRQPGVEYIHTEKPLTKRQRRRKRGKK